MADPAPWGDRYSLASLANKQMQVGARDVKELDDLAAAGPHWGRSARGPVAGFGLTLYSRPDVVVG